LLLRAQRSRLLRAELLPGDLRGRPLLLHHALGRDVRRDGADLLRRLRRRLRQSERWQLLRTEDDAGLLERTLLLDRVLAGCLLLRWPVGSVLRRCC
jgi:hypothetical protein